MRASLRKVSFTCAERLKLISACAALNTPADDEVIRSLLVKCVSNENNDIHKRLLLKPEKVTNNTDEKERVEC